MTVELVPQDIKMFKVQYSIERTSGQSTKSISFKDTFLDELEQKLGHVSPNAQADTNQWDKLMKDTFNKRQQASGSYMTNFAVNSFLNIGFING